MKKSKKEKRSFASEQFSELRGMGFSRRAANLIMREARPALAVQAAEWARSAWEATGKRLQEERGNFFAKPPIGGSERDALKPLTPEEVRESLLEIVQGGINDLCQPGLQLNDLVIKHQKLIFARAKLTLPTADPFELRRLLAGAQEAIGAICAREIAERDRQSISR